MKNEATEQTPNKDWIFFGVPCNQKTFEYWMAQMNKGFCPFCKRSGLSNKYGSIKKHVVACAKEQSK